MMFLTERPLPELDTYGNMSIASELTALLLTPAASISGVPSPYLIH